MPNAEQPSAQDDPEDLPAPGSRWGAGAQSVLPYLTKTLQAKPANNDARDATRPPGEGRNPVFNNWPPRPRA